MARRDDMSRKYRKRITEFLKDMTEGPVTVQDYYELQRRKMVKSNMDNTGKSSSHMVFRAPRNDQDIIKDMRGKTKFLDTDPPIMTEAVAWNMRPRDK